MTKEELHKVNELTAQIRKLESRLEQFRCFVERITQELDGLPRGVGYQRSKVEELTLKVVELEREIETLKVERAEARADLLSEITLAVHDDAQQFVLMERYGYATAFSKIADKMHLAENTVYNLHRKGLKNLLVGN